MIFLILSIACSVTVSVLLKLARAQNWSLAQMVGVNYCVAIVLSYALLNPDFSHWQETILPHACLFGVLGVLLPSVFIVMGKAAQTAGIVKADAAQRLSLFIPVLAAFTLFGETLTLNRGVGLALAILALFCLLNKPRQAQDNRMNIWLLGVWLGYGIIDVLFKQLSKAAGTGGNLLMMFSVAAVLMLAYLFVSKTQWTRQSMAAGAVLGALNFGNILFYIQAHRAFSDSPTLVFAGMNMGVIALGTILGAVVFKEKISAINALGVVLALMAVGCLFLWVV